jgi:hypothetical protein
MVTGAFKRLYVTKGNKKIIQKGGKRKSEGLPGHCVAGKESRTARKFGLFFYTLGEAINSYDEKEWSKKQKKNAFQTGESFLVIPSAMILIGVPAVVCESVIDDIYGSVRRSVDKRKL